MKQRQSQWLATFLAVSILSALPLLAAAQQPGKPLTPEQMREQMMERGYGPGYGPGGGYGPGYGMGPGMMGGYGGWGMGPGMMGGYGDGPGYGMGPGMMGGYGGWGMGPGMMGMMGGGYGYGMGPGMMGGYGGWGMGPGMMGGYGYGMGPLHMLNLSDDQRDKIEKIRDAERQKHWDISGKILQEQNKLRDLYQAEEQDPKKIGAVYGNIAKLQQQMLEIHVQANNEAQKTLTKEQREQLKQWNRGSWGPGDGYGPGYGRGPGMMQQR